MQIGGNYICEAVSPSSYVKAVRNKPGSGRTLCPCCQLNKARLRKAFNKPGKGDKPKYKDQRNNNKLRFLIYNQ